MPGNTSAISKADARCGECVWWRQYDTGRATRSGTCHRMPPTAIPFVDDADAERARHGKALWPRMREGDWCGEFTMMADLSQ